MARFAQVEKKELITEQIDKAGQLLDQLKASNTVTREMGSFAATLDPIIATVIDVYQRTRLVGTLVIYGGVLSVVLTFVALTPLVQVAPHEFAALAWLAALLVVAGGLLYAFLNVMQYKTYIASQHMLAKKMELAARNQELQLATLAEHTKTLGQLAEVTEASGLDLPIVPAPDFTGQLHADDQSGRSHPLRDLQRSRSP